MNDEQSFLDFDKLAQNIQTYESCKNQRSNLIKMMGDTEEKSKEICHFESQDVTKWIHL